MRPTILAGILLLLSAACVAEPVKLRFLGAPVAGLLFSNDDGKTVEGPAFDVMSRVATMAGVQATFELYPRARALGMLDGVYNACALGLLRSDERIPLYKWAGPIVRQRLVLFKRFDDPLQINSLDDIKNLRIGVEYGTLIAKELQADGMKVEGAYDDSTNLRKLNARRIDLWGAHEQVALPVIHAASTPPPRLAFVLKTVDGYLGCNRHVDDETMKALDGAIKSLVAAGAFAKIGISPEHK